MTVVDLRTCPASGWHVHPSCTGPDGMMTCPSCERPVPTSRARIGRRPVRLITEHLCR